MSGDDRFLARSAVFVVIRNGRGEVLLQRRAGTGYMDGRYDLPSGHVERGEKLLDAAARELREETGIEVRVSDLKLWHINQFCANNIDYYNFFFLADTWQGEAVIGEPDKCDDISFWPIGRLPEMTAGTHVALEQLTADAISFGYIDQKVFDRIAAPGDTPKG